MKWGPWFLYGPIVRRYRAVRSETGWSAGAAAPTEMSQREKSKSWKWEKKACAWRKRSSRSPPLNTLDVLPHRDLWYKGFDTSFQGLLQEIGVAVEMETSAGASLKWQTMSFLILLALWQAGWMFVSLWYLKSKENVWKLFWCGTVFQWTRTGSFVTWCF